MFATMDDATRTLTEAFAERYSLPKYRLRVIDGADAGREKVFDQRLIYVGSAPDNDLVVEDPSVSRNHLKIEGERLGYRVRDLGSKNGTWLAGNRLVEGILAGSAVLRLGQSEVAFELLDEVHEVACRGSPALVGCSENPAKCVRYLRCSPASPRPT